MLTFVDILLGKAARVAALTGFICVSVTVCDARPQTLEIIETISFAYDEAGNRVTREIYLPTLPPPPFPTAPQTGTTAGLFYDTMGDYEVRISYDLWGRISVEILNLPSGVDAVIEIHSVSGVKIVDIPVCDAVTEVDISGQPAGVYLLSVSAGADRTIWKIIKR